MSVKQMITNVTSEALINALNSATMEQRRKIVEALQKMNEPSVLPLLNALSNKNAIVRKSAAEALGSNGGIFDENLEISISSKLLELLYLDSDETVWMQAGITLGKFQSGKNLMQEKLHQNQSISEITRLIWAIGHATDPIFLEPLFLLLENPDGLIRELVIQAIAKMGKSQIPILLKELISAKNDKQIGIIKVLGFIGDERANPILLNLLLQNQFELRAATVWALVRTFDIKIIEKLITFLGHDSYEVRLATISIIAEINNEVILARLLDFVNSTDEKLQWSLLEIFSRTKYVNSLELVNNLLSSENETIREKAQEAMQYIKKM